MAIVNQFPAGGGLCYEIKSAKSALAGTGTTRIAAIVQLTEITNGYKIKLEGFSSGSPTQNANGEVLVKIQQNCTATFETRAGTGSGTYTKQLLSGEYLKYTPYSSRPSSSLYRYIQLEILNADLTTKESVFTINVSGSGTTSSLYVETTFS